MSPTKPCSPAKEGLDAYRALAPQLPRLLNQAGLPRSKSGTTRRSAVTALLARDGLQRAGRNDLADRPRAVLLTWN